MRQEFATHFDRRAPSALDRWIERIAPVPWSATVGAAAGTRAPETRPLYTPEERVRRDRSPWTIVQAILAPLQFLVFIASLALVLQYLTRGTGHDVASLSVVLKTGVLYAIMITGAIWEKDVFGRWLFAPAFFWEDVFSMLVIALHTGYVAAVLMQWGTPREQMMLALAAYATYVINAAQFLIKFRAARIEAQQAARARPALGVGAA
jgi:3-vinyl bacteriochlorophyllide hydratase